MRLIGNVSGLGDWDTSSISLDDINAIDSSVDSAYGTITPQVGTYNTATPTVNNPVAANGWTNLLQSVIQTGVSTASKIAVTQNAVPQLQPGTYYTYNAKTGSYVMGNNPSGSANLVTSSGATIFSSPLVLLALAGIGLVLVFKNR